jgi:hypothetical protein
VLLVGLNADGDFDDFAHMWWVLLLPSLGYVVWSCGGCCGDQVRARREGAKVVELMTSPPPVAENPAAHAEAEFAKQFQMHRCGTRSAIDVHRCQVNAANACQ